VFTLAALSAIETTAQQHKVQNKSEIKSSPAKSDPVDVDRFLSFRVGSRWAYKVCGKRIVGPGPDAPVKSQCEHYSETVVSVQTIHSAVRLVELVRIGDGTDFAFCGNEEKQQGPLHSWFIVDGLNVYSRCDKKEATDLASLLSEHAPGNSFEGSPEYVLPFDVGAFWGADPAMPKRDDKFYRWNVKAKKNVSVPAGKFHGCYELVFQTLPDHEERWICAGVGLVADEYTHNGTTNHYRIELQSFEVKK
jgi:hypothetical protein